MPTLIDFDDTNITEYKLTSKNTEIFVWYL